MSDVTVHSGAAYSHPEIGDLAVQMRHTPPRLLGRQLDGLERLLSLIDPQREYPYDWVLFQITGYDRRGPETGTVGNGPAAGAAGALLPGKSLLGDLTRLAWEFAQPQSAADEPVFTLAEVAERLGVSEKTVTRWRRRGLPARPWAYPDGRIRVGIRQSELTAFLEQNGEQVARAAGLTRLSPEETAGIVALAREVRADGAATLYQVARRVAERVGRAVETVRYTLHRHDEARPEDAVFPELLPPLPDAVKLEVFERRGRGESFESLSAAFRRPRGVLEQAVEDGRILALVREPIAFIDNPEFRDADADTVIRREAAEIMSAPATNPAARVPDGTPAYLAHLYSVPLLTAVQERALFRLYNYLKFRAGVEQSWLRHRPVVAATGDLALDVDAARALCDETERHVRAFESLLREAGEVKNRIIGANLRLVVSVAKGHAGPRTPLFELISDGNVSLMRAIEKFDYARGNRFSTYAVYVISRDYARSLPDEAHWLRHLVAPGEAKLADAAARSEDEEDSSLRQAAGRLGEMLGRLSEKERSVLECRYGLTGTDGAARPVTTLEELGRRMGVSGERVRQIEKGALLKLRGWLRPVSERN